LRYVAIPKKILTGQRVVAKAAQHAAGHEVHAARRHAVVRCLDNHADALRFQDIIDGGCGEVSLTAAGDRAA
jgi:hypothetical protein